MSFSTPEAPTTRVTEPAPNRRQPTAALSLAAIGLLVLINGLRSASSVASKYLLNDFGPCTLTVFRFLPAGLLLVGHAKDGEDER